MKKYLLATVGLCALLVFAAQSHALVIDPALTPYCLSGPETSQDDINALIKEFIGTDEYLYKSEVGVGEYGPLSDSYETEYFNTPSDPSDAAIEYTGGDIVGVPAFLLVKDGNQDPAWYLYCLSSLFGWDGVEIIELENFWPNGGAISHVTLYGSRQVPEPATMLLLGSGLIGLGFLGRKKLFKK